MRRVAAVFQTREAVLGAIDAARTRGLMIVTALLPAYDAAVIDAVGVPPAWCGRVALIGGIAGSAAGLLFPAWAVAQWPRVIVGGKPLLSWPTFLVIAFELMLLGAALGAVAAFLAGAWRGRRAARPLSDLVRSSASDASFALLIECPPDRAREAAELMDSQGAVTCRVG